jgi:hypothetical protein
MRGIRRAGGHNAGEQRLQSQRVGCDKRNPNSPRACSKRPHGPPHPARTLPRFRSRLEPRGFGRAAKAVDRARGGRAGTARSVNRTSITVL